MVLRIASAPAGEPVRRAGTSSQSVARSIAIVANDSPTLARMQASGTRQTRADPARP